MTGHATAPQSMSFVDTRGTFAARVALRSMSLNGVEVASAVAK